MKSSTIRYVLLAVSLILLGALVFWVIESPKDSIAMVYVQDAAGQPVAGAVVKPEGLRTKSGPFMADWYGWQPASNEVPNLPVITDQHGCAHVPYPKYVFERIETGVICLSVNHSNFVPERPELVVSTSLPAGAPIQSRVEHMWDRIRNKTLFARTDPVVLQRGAMLEISVEGDVLSTPDSTLCAQVSGGMATTENFWFRPSPGVIATRRLPTGQHTVRAVMVHSNGATWFGDVRPVTAVAGETNTLRETLKPGVNVVGRIDAEVPRPVMHGRVVAHVWPTNSEPSDYPPQWHSWAAVEEDGSFIITSLPTGNLELVALCDGFVSTNGPGNYGFRYPQTHSLDTNDISVTIGMEPTARLEVLVLDELGEPLPGVSIETWPNVRYGEWSATLLAGDCYITSERLLAEAGHEARGAQKVEGFRGVSDSSGLSILANVPPEVTKLAAFHPEYTLPIVELPSGRKERQAGFNLKAGQTNRITIRLERKEESSISHY